MNRLVEGVGQFPLLRSVAPLRDGVTDQIVRLAAYAHRRVSRIALVFVETAAVTGPWARVQVERIDK
jgi:hypothetical protein